MRVKKLTSGKNREFFRGLSEAYNYKKIIVDYSGIKLIRHNGESVYSIGNNTQFIAGLLHSGKIDYVNLIAR